MKESSNLFPGLLIQKGHCRIGYIAGPLHSSTMIDRLSGFRLALEQYGLEAFPQYIQQGSLTLESGYEVMKYFLSLPELPTAIIFANDQMLFGGMKALAEKGIPIPEGMAVIGFDNVPLCSFVKPTVTSIEIPKYELGVAATQLLFTLLQGQTPEYPVWFPVRLIERESTATTVYTKIIQFSSKLRE
ncbi:MAG: substrate-binding domain-containing protein [Spirochaetales bacterium]